MNKAIETNLHYDRINRFEQKNDSQIKRKEQLKNAYRDELAKQIEEKKIRKLEEEKRKREQDIFDEARIQKYEKTNRPLSYNLTDNNKKTDILDDIVKKTNNYKQDVSESDRNVDFFQPRPYSTMQNQNINMHNGIYNDSNIKNEGEVPGIKPPIDTLNNQIIKPKSYENTHRYLNIAHNPNNLNKIYPDTYEKLNHQESLSDKMHNAKAGSNDQMYYPVYIQNDRAIIDDLKKHIMLLNEYVN